MSYVAACNVTDRPVVVDDEGRTLGGGEWGAVLKAAEPVKGALDRAELVELDGDAGTPEARAAVDVARLFDQRAAAFAKLDAVALLVLAREHDVTFGPFGTALADLTVAELRHTLTVRTGIPVPAKKASEEK